MFDSLNGDHSNYISEDLEIYMNQGNKGQPQQGGRLGSDKS
jgi:hypothetical protein